MVWVGVKPYRSNPECGVALVAVPLRRGAGLVEEEGAEGPGRAWAVRVLVAASSQEHGAGPVGPWPQLAWGAAPGPGGAAAGKKAWSVVCRFTLVGEPVVRPGGGAK